MPTAVLVASGWLGQVRRHADCGEHRHDLRDDDETWRNEIWRMDEVFARARAAPSSPATETKA